MGLSAIRQAGLSKARIEALTDGIFATVMTVLVLGLRSPALGLSEGDLKSQIFQLWPNILVYAFSFVVLGLYWIGHHNQFHYIKQTDRIFLWINIIFLLTIGFIPFSTSLIGEYPFSPTAVRVYGANLAATGWRSTASGGTRQGTVISSRKISMHISSALHRNEPLSDRSFALLE